MSSSDKIKCVVTGDGEVGKKSMLVSYTTNNFPEEYVPTVIDNNTMNVTVDSRTYQLFLWGVSGQENYERLRPLSYPQTDVFLLCFSIDSPTSFDSAKSKWFQELQQYSPGVPIILVGTKSDLRGSSVDCIPKARGEQLAAELKAFKYMECSSKTREGLKQVFDAAVQCVISSRAAPSPDRKKLCLIS